MGKRGYLQCEIREALDLWKEKLEDDIFLMPVRLDDTPVPESLQKFQWVDFSQQDNCEGIVSSIRVGFERQHLDTQRRSGNQMQIERMKLAETFSGPPQFSVEFEYPQFKGSDFAELEEINARILGFVLEQVQDIRKNRPDTLTAQGSSTDVAPWNAYSLYGFYSITLHTQEFMSISFHVQRYDVGAAHPRHLIRSFSFGVRPPLDLQLRDLFREGSDYPSMISAYCMKDLRTQASNEGYDITDTIEMGAGPDPENFVTFNLTRDSLVISFQDYAVGPHSWDLRQVALPFSFLKVISNPAPIFSRLFENV